MALFDSSTPYSGQLQNIAGALTSTGLPAIQQGSSYLGGAQGGQGNLAQILQGLAGPTYAGGVGAATGVESFLQQLSQGTAAGGAAGAGNLSNILAQLGVGTAPQGIASTEAAQSALMGAGTSGADIAGALFGQGVTTESTGLLPPSAQPLVQRSLNEQIQGIKGKYASLGMSGSSAEQEEITNAQNNNLGLQFQLSGQLGQAEVGQGLNLLSTSLGAFGTAGNLGTALTGAGGGFLTSAGGLQSTLANLGFTGLATSGSLGTTLGQLGLSTYGLSSNDLANLAQEALSQMGFGQAGLQGAGGVFQNLAQSQITQDNNMTSAFGGFFKALAGNSGLFGSAGLLPGGQQFFGGNPTSVGTAQQTSTSGF